MTTTTTPQAESSKPGTTWIYRYPAGNEAAKAKMEEVAEKNRQRCQECGRETKHIIVESQSPKGSLMDCYSIECVDSDKSHHFV